MALKYVAHDPVTGKEIPGTEFENQPKFDKYCRNWLIGFLNKRGLKVREDLNPEAFRIENEELRKFRDAEQMNGADVAVIRLRSKPDFHYFWWNFGPKNPGRDMKAVELHDRGYFRLATEAEELNAFYDKTACTTAAALDPRQDQKKAALTDVAKDKIVQRLKGLLAAMDERKYQRSSTLNSFLMVAGWDEIVSAESAAKTAKAK